MDIEKKIRETSRLSSGDLSPKPKHTSEKEELEIPTRTVEAPVKAVDVPAKAIEPPVKDISDLDDDDDDEAHGGQPPKKHVIDATKLTRKGRVDRVISLAIDVDRLDQEVRDHKAALGSKEQRAIDLRSELEELLDS